MSLKIVGNRFLNVKFFGDFENKLINYVSSNIKKCYKNDCNLLVNGIWFGPQYNNGAYEEALTYKNKIDNVFYLSVIDPVTLNKDQLKKFFEDLGNPKVFLLGNFDDSKYRFSVFGNLTLQIIGNHEVEQLTNIKYKFLNYNGKPAKHRQDLYNDIINNSLSQYGIITLNKQVDIYNKITPITTNEVSFKDAFSFGPPDIWNHHFLNVVSETTFNWRDDVFVSEKTFRPILGLRPFIINGNWKTYKWLEDNGFKTFEKYFPFAKFRLLRNHEIHPEIIKVIKWVCEQSEDELLELYNEMLPDLLHNRNRIFEFAKEEQQIMENILL